MKSPRATQQAALVIQWPQTAAIPVARETAKRLAARNIPATWAVDQASQIESLTSWGAARSGADAALLAAPGMLADAGANDNAAARELARRLELLRDTGLGVDVIHAGHELVGEHWPRTLRALGVHGVVVDCHGEPAPARALPFGVWRFSPHATAPRVRRWTNLFTAKRPLLAGAAAGPLVAAIDLSRVEAPGSRGWREVERALDEAAAARSAGTIALVTMGALTAQFTQASAPRPQRSILRAA